MRQVITKYVIKTYNKSILRKNVNLCKIFTTFFTKGIDKL
jgi:hypothetical protein